MNNTLPRIIQVAINYREIEDVCNFRVGKAKWTTIDWSARWASHEVQCGDTPASRRAFIEILKKGAK